MTNNYNWSIRERFSIHENTDCSLLQETHLGFGKTIPYFMQGPWAIWRCSACPHLIWCLCLHFNFIFFNSLCQNKQHSMFTIRPLFTTLKIQWFSERFILNDGYCNKQDMNKHDFQINHYSFFYSFVSYYYSMFKLHRAQQNNTENIAYSMPTFYCRYFIKRSKHIYHLVQSGCSSIQTFWFELKPLTILFGPSIDPWRLLPRAHQSSFHSNRSAFSIR